MPFLRSATRTSNGILCSFCQEFEEAPEHLFWGCPISLAVWRQGPWHLNSRAFGTLPIQQWICFILEPCNFPRPNCASWPQIMLAISVTLDSIWGARNKLSMRGIFQLWQTWLVWYKGSTLPIYRLGKLPLPSYLLCGIRLWRGRLRLILMWPSRQVICVLLRFVAIVVVLSWKYLLPDYWMWSIKRGGLGGSSGIFNGCNI